MFQNRKTIYILVIGLLILFLFYYNQNTQQNEVLNSEANLSLLKTSNTAEKHEKNESDSQIIVHLAGAVKNAGVYKLNKSDRLVDLIKAAGGLRENADLKQVNLAESLYDGQKLIIPEILKKSELGKFNYDQKNIESLDQEKNESILINNYSNSGNSDLININQANQSQLEELSGIGPSKAAAIIKYREQNSYFSQKEDLLKISGIGEKTLENIKDEIVLQ